MPQNIFDNAVSLTLEIRRLGVRRKVRSDRVDVRGQTEESTTDPKALHVSKDLLESASYAAIVSLDNAFRAELARIALPSPLRRGCYLVPVACVPDLERRIDEYNARRRAIVDDFLGVYPSAVRAARTRLGPLFDPDDYPAVDEVRAAFSVRTRYESFGVPGILESIDRNLLSRERSRFESDLRDAAEEVKAAMRAGLRDLIQHLSDRLTPNDDGTPRIFRDSAVTNITEWLELFEARNIAGDEQLAQLVTQARAVLNGADPKSLRTAPIVREMVRNGLSEVNAQLGALTQERPRRRFNFDDAPPAEPPAAPSDPSPVETPA